MSFGCAHAIPGSGRDHLTSHADVIADCALDHRSPALNAHYAARLAAARMAHRITWRPGFLRCSQPTGSRNLSMTVEEPDLDLRAPSVQVSEPTRRRIALRRIGAVFAGVAGIGAVLGGFTGYWSAYRTVTTEFLAPALPKANVFRLSIAIMPFANLSGD